MQYQQLKIEYQLLKIENIYLKNQKTPNNRKSELKIAKKNNIERQGKENPRK